MENLWTDKEAVEYCQDELLGLRVYTSQLLGRNADLVLHGGGNTSVKASVTNLFGDDEQVLFVKGSGWDLKTIAADGFAPTRLETLKKLGALDSLSDSEMMQQLRLALLNPSAPTPSVEAILHALIPYKYVDHTHADAVVAISNTANGEQLLREIYGKEVLILPYIMPGFVLAKQVHEQTRDLDWGELKGIVLLHHGIFTFDDDGKASYDRMIELVSKAEDFLVSKKLFTLPALTNRKPAAGVNTSSGSDSLPLQDHLRLAALRKQAAEEFGSALLASWQRDTDSMDFSSLKQIEEIATRGPLTPDHTIHAKAFAAIYEEDPLPGFEQFRQNYQSYFDDHSQTGHIILDKVPRYGVWKERGMVYIAANAKRLNIVKDISRHTMKAIQWGEGLGGWQALPREALFEVEYWELEQAKLKLGQQAREMEGKVVLVTGAASGIGKACVKEFCTRGACVIALDINPQITELNFGFSSGSGLGVIGIVCDVTNDKSIVSALQQGIEAFGGIDTVVSNAGVFTATENLQDLQDENWQKSIDVNLTSHMRILRHSIPFLELGVVPSVVIIASKNVPAPGPGAGAYSVAKAGLTQMARVAALELAEKGIRVNTLHPNAVFDTAIWTEEVLAQRAKSYQLSVEQYKKNNLLHCEVTSSDVAVLAAIMAGKGFSKTTGAQVAVDGGNERVI